MLKKAMTLKARELTNAISKMDEKKLIDLSLQHKSKKCSYNFKDALTELSDKEITDMWEQLKTMIIKHSDNMFKIKEEDNTEVCFESSQILQAAIDLAQVMLDEKLTLSDAMLHMIVFLNGILFDIPAILETLKNNIALLCEKLFHLNYAGQDQTFTYNTFIYLLKRSVNSKATKKDVKRIYAIRSLIPKVLAMDDVDKNEIWDLFKKCATSSLYNSMNEGQKIITMTLTLDLNEVSKIHQAIMKKMSSCSKKQAICYGKAYLEAWIHSVKTEDEKLKNELEICCIQDIILSAIMKRPKPVVDSLRRVLSQFHSQKKEAYVAKMLYELYHPIIWRYLKHPDGLIRAHAAQLFLDVFPLEDPDYKVVTADLELNEQFILIQDLLVDDFPIVRTTTVARLCVSMSANWEIFPEDTLKTYFKIIINELSYDSSSSEVRTAVAKGLKALLENPLTTCTLRAVLPKVKHLFHDISDSVRVAFCSLLLKVKQICAIKYFDIVPIDELLARLEEDFVTAKLIVNLICNSFFPKDKAAEEWLLRCSSIIKKSQTASRVLFQYMPHFTPHQNVAKFISQAVCSIHFFVKSTVTQGQMAKKKSSRSTRGNSIDESTDELSLGKACGFDDPVMLTGYIDGFVIMWLATVNSLKKPENKVELKRLVGKLSKYLSELALHFKDSEVFPSIAYLGSYLASVHIPCLASLCFVRLSNMTDESQPHEWKTMLRCLCNQMQEVALLDLLREWIEPEFTQIVQQPASKKRKGAKGKVVTQSKHKLAVKMLNFLLSDKLCQKILLESQPDKLKSFLDLFHHLQQRIIQLQQKTISEEERDFVKELFHVLIKISALLEHKSIECESVKFVEDAVAWTENTLCQLAWPIKNEKSRRKSKKLCSPTFELLALSICKDLCTVAGDIACLGMINIKANKYVKFAMNLLKTGKGPAMLLQVSKLLWKHIHFGVYLSTVKKQDNVLTIIPDCFSNIIHFLRDNDFLDALPTGDVREIQSVLSLSLQTMYHHGVLKEAMSDIISCFMKNVLSSAVESISEDWETIQTECKTFSKIQTSKSSSFLLSIMSNRQKILVYFLNLFNKHMIKSDRDMKSWVACCVVLHQVHETKNISKNLNKEMNVIKNTLNKIVLELHPLEAKTLDELVCNEHQLTNINENAENSQTVPKEKLSFNVHCHLEIKTLKNMLHSKTKGPEKRIEN